MCIRDSDVTNADGDYFVGGLEPGDYIVYIPTPDADNSISSTPTDTADNQEDGDDNGDQATDGAAVTSPVISLVFGDEPTGTDEAGSGGDADDANDANGDMTVDFGFFEPASIGDFVFLDEDNDGIQDAMEPGVEGVTVTLTDENGDPVTDVNGDPVDPQTTGPDGAYDFEDLFPGDYIVTFDNPNADQTPTTENVNGDADDEGADDSDVDPVTGESDVVTLTSGEDEDDIDAGYVPANMSIGSTVFSDSDNNGMQDAGEEGIEGCLLYTSPSPRDLSTSRMPSSA